MVKSVFKFYFVKIFYLQILIQSILVQFGVRMFFLRLIVEIIISLIVESVKSSVSMLFFRLIVGSIKRVMNKVIILLLSKVSSS